MGSIGQISFLLAEFVSAFFLSGGNGAAVGSLFAASALRYPTGEEREASERRWQSPWRRGRAVRRHIGSTRYDIGTTKCIITRDRRGTEFRVRDGNA